MYQKTAHLSIALFLALLMILNTACNQNATETNDNQQTEVSEQDNKKLLKGLWRGALSVADENDLPFNFLVDWKDEATCEMTIMNGEERIKVKDITINDDSIFIKMPIYDSEIKGKYNNRRIIGEWYNYAKGKDYMLLFYAAYGDSTRFQLPTPTEEVVNVDGRWEVVFMSDDKKSKTDAIAEFKQDGDKVTGTFLTPTGDYRYLEGQVTEDELYLSTFDGSHAFVFKAKVDSAASSMQGDFWSGRHWHEIWLAFRNDTITMPSSESMTKMKPNKTTIDFSFPNLEGKEVSLQDEKFKNKVVVVQVLGSWCPNCRDETELFSKIYNKYRGKGLEMVGLAFENGETLEAAKPILQRYKEHFNIGYDLLYAGKASKKVASEALPNLTEIKAFPTSIFIDRNGKVRHIHTGFSGPATQNYQKEVAKIEGIIQDLMNETM